eukprot:Amastigsp_a175245_65.p1 type:complete len:233 gc:universal Amastigsp_a175245_65:1074-376(-)
MAAARDRKHASRACVRGPRGPRCGELRRGETLWALLVSAAFRTLAPHRAIRKPGRSLERESRSELPAKPCALRDSVPCAALTRREHFDSLAVLRAVSGLCNKPLSAPERPGATARRVGKTRQSRNLTQAPETIRENTRGALLRLDAVTAAVHHDSRRHRGRRIRRRDRGVRNKPSRRCRRVIGRRVRRRRGRNRSARSSLVFLHPSRVRPRIDHHVRPQAPQVRKRNIKRLA